MGIQEAIKELCSSHRNLLEGYISRTAQIDAILILLTREFCAHCPRNRIYGCCDFADESVREMPPEAIRIQEIECLENGGNLKEYDGLCRYHTPGGCSLRLMKSSSCLGHLCDDLKEMFVVEYGDDAKPFISAMERLVTGSLMIYPEVLFRDMDEAILLGRRLVGK